ncbi:MAG: DUF1294 domain-containing protein [Clostridia bacterium]
MNDWLLLGSLIFGVFLLANLVAFFVYWLDKRKAIKGNQRISEKALLIYALCFGAIGAFISMHKFHHKTRKWKFKICVPLFGIINLVLLYFIAYFVFR